MQDNCAKMETPQRDYRLLAGIQALREVRGNAHSLRTRIESTVTDMVGGQDVACEPKPAIPPPQSIADEVETIAAEIQRIISEINNTLDRL